MVSKKQVRSVLPLAGGIILTAVGVSLTYLVFEHIIKHAIPFVWNDAFQTDTFRLLVLPVSIGLGLLYFWAQHHFDPQSDKHEEHALGDIPAPTIKNFIKVLALGFLSLLAGATLGVESILVPASIILGVYVASKVFKKQSLGKPLGAAGFIALFTAFFGSFWIGLLSVYLLAKSQGRRVDVRLLAIAVGAAGVSWATLTLLAGGEAGQYATLPSEGLGFSPMTVLVSALLLGAGFVATYVIYGSHVLSARLRRAIPARNWALHGLIAGGGIGVIYLLGGTYVQFTGNLSIVPLFEQASVIGVLGLLWIAFVKAVAIGWSKAMQYRGGLIFPLIFVASVYVDIVLQYTGSVNYIIALSAVVVGAFVANNKLRILF